MNIPKFFVVLFVLECSIVTVAGTSNGGASRFDAEYPAAYQKLKDFYSRSQIEIRENLKDGIYTYKYFGDGTSFRCDETFRPESDTVRPLPDHVMVANPELSFRLSKGPKSADFSVLTMGKAEGRNLEGVIDMIRLRATPAFAPYCLLEFPIPEFIKTKTFRKIREVNVTNGGVNRVRIEWDCPISRDHKRTGYFDFDPDRCWAMTEYQFQYEQLSKLDGKVKTSGRNARIVYSGQVDGVPLIKSIEIRPLGAVNEPPASTTSVASLLPGAAPKSAFRPEAFGLGVKATPPTPLAAYLIALATLSGAAAVGFRVLRNRQGRAA